MSFQSGTHLPETIDDNFEVDIQGLNAAEFGALAAVAGMTVASIGITSVAAPTVIATGAVCAGAGGIVGYKLRHGHLPFMGDKDAPAPAPTPGVVTDAGGTPAAVASI